jgi:transposase
MRLFVDVPKIYLHRRPVDFRKQINGLSVIVEEDLSKSPFEESLYVFVNGSRNRVKILFWQRNGFCLWLKRLEKDKFAWPKHLTQDLIELTEEELNWLLSGFDLWRQPPHARLHYTSVR